MNAIIIYGLLSLSSIDLCQQHEVKGKLAKDLYAVVGSKKFSHFNVGTNKKLKNLKSMKGMIHEGFCQKNGHTYLCRYCLKGNPSQ